MAAPVGGDVGEPFEAMGNAVVDLLLVWVGLVVCLADTLCDNLGVALAVTGVLAIRALHACSILEEFSAQRTAHDVVELLGDKLVALLFVNLLLLLAHGTLTVQTNVERTTVLQLLGCVPLACLIFTSDNIAFRAYQSSFEAELDQLALGQTMIQSSRLGGHWSSRRRGALHVPQCRVVLQSWRHVKIP